MKMLVLGVSLHQGEYEGNKYDYMKVYMVARQQQSDERKGSAGIDMRADSSLFQQASKIDFKQPLFCDLETEMQATGGGNMKETIVNITPCKP